MPAERSERKEIEPLRYVAIRIRRRQEEMLADSSREKHFAVLSKRWELTPGRLIQWHREKAGTIQAVHDVLKNELSAGVMPSKYFGANAAWLRLAVIAHNVLTALKRIALPAEFLRARPKRLRLLLINTAGRIVQHARRTILRLAALVDCIAFWKEALRLLPVATGEAGSRAYRRILLACLRPAEPDYACEARSERFLPTRRAIRLSGAPAVQARSASPSPPRRKITLPSTPRNLIDGLWSPSCVWQFPFDRHILCSLTAEHKFVQHQQAVPVGSHPGNIWLSADGGVCL